MCVFKNIKIHMPSQPQGDSVFFLIFMYGELIADLYYDNNDATITIYYVNDGEK